MSRKAASKKANIVPTGFNKGVFAEFVIFLFLQGFNLYAVWSVLSDAVNDNERYDKTAKLDPSIPSRKNYTSKPTGYCSQEPFDQKQITDTRNSYIGMIEAYFAFVVIAALIFSFHFLLWVFTLVFSYLIPDFLQEHWTLLVRGKAMFTLAANFVQDIPCSVIATQLFLLRRGAMGLICWECAMDLTCLHTARVEELMAPSSSKLTVLVLGVILATMWKSISFFFRWSRLDECELFLIRAATSLFAGFLYMCIIVTPMFAIMKYQYFILPGIQPGLLASIIDKVFIVGVLFWAIGILGVCCCPLLKLIRLAS